MVWNFLSTNGAAGLQMRRIIVNILNKKIADIQQEVVLQLGVWTWV
jgi:hypothetical protein